MGNHTAGDIIHRNITRVLGERKPEDVAIDLLDRAMKAAKATPGFSPDAEFEATDPDDPNSAHPDFDDWRYPHRDNPMGIFLIEVFAENGLDDLDFFICAIDEDDEEGIDLWWEDIAEPFSKRYGLC